MQILANKESKADIKKEVIEILENLDVFLKPLHYLDWTIGASAKDYTRYKRAITQVICIVNLQLGDLFVKVQDFL